MIDPIEELKRTGKVTPPTPYEQHQVDLMLVGLLPVCPPLQAIKLENITHHRMCGRITSKKGLDESGMRKAII